jgi:laminin, alpha 3/5
MICACPLPIDSNNFATGCEVSPDGFSISCDCKPGYTGHKCQSCANGFYGSPEIPGEICKPCQCSGNIDPSMPGSCDRYFISYLITIYFITFKLFHFKCHW